jgi:hypothetical protein
MVVVAIAGLLFSALEGLDREEMHNMAENSSEWARYYAAMGRKESNPQYRQSYAEWQKEMEYYSRH